MYYFFLSRHDLSEEIDVSWVYLRQEGMPIMGQEGVKFLLAATFFLKLHDIYSRGRGLISIHFGNNFDFKLYLPVYLYTL